MNILAATVSLLGLHQDTFLRSCISKGIKTLENLALIDQPLKCSFAPMRRAMLQYLCHRIQYSYNMLPKSCFAYFLVLLRRISPI